MSPKRVIRRVKRKLPQPVRKIVWWLPLVILAGVGIVATAGFMGMARLEETNTFCASCHTQPETTYLARFTASTQVDLASDHFAKKGANCIDCHSGEGVGGRLAAEFEGAGNAIKYVTHTMTQPAKMLATMGDDHCLKCHSGVTAQRDINNHFHYFLSRWQAQSADAGHCVDCHNGHNNKGSADIGFLEQQQTEAVCQRCHTVLREGGG
jgi:hypothetical protein